jgi:signal transduction histidine kinase
MPSGGRVTISLFEDSRGENGAATVPNAVLQVTDTGHGMSDATVRQALTSFFTTKPAQKGTGLGLAMVNDFAIRTGGSVAIESAVGKGTIVTLRLPSAETAAQAIVGRSAQGDFGSGNVPLLGSCGLRGPSSIAGYGCARVSCCGCP